MAITVNHSVKASLSHNATLADLMELVEAALHAGLGSDARVTVQHYAGDPREGSYTTITVAQQ